MLRSSIHFFDLDGGYLANICKDEEHLRDTLTPKRGWLCIVGSLSSDTRKFYEVYLEINLYCLISELLALSQYSQISFSIMWICNWFLNVYFEPLVERVSFLTMTLSRRFQTPTNPFSTLSSQENRAQDLCKVSNPKLSCSPYIVPGHLFQLRMVLKLWQGVLNNSTCPERFTIAMLHNFHEVVGNVFGRWEVSLPQLNKNRWNLTNREAKIDHLAIHISNKHAFH